MSGLSISSTLQTIIERGTERQISPQDIIQPNIDVSAEVAAAADMVVADQVIISKQSEDASAILRGYQMAESPLDNSDIQGLKHDLEFGKYLRSPVSIAEAMLKFEGRLAKRQNRG